MDTIPPQPTVLVTGSVERRLHSVAIELFDERTTAGDGVVLVTTRGAPTALSERLAGDPDGIAPDDLAVVDARGANDGARGTDGGARGTDDSEPAVGRFRRVASDIDPDGMVDSVSDALSWLAAAGIDRRHFLYDALALGPQLPDEEGTYDRTYRLAMTVGAEEGLALFTLDDAGFSEDAVAELGHLFDVHVELRDDDGTTELRWTGLLGASDGWVVLADADLGVGGFR